MPSFVTLQEVKDQLEIEDDSRNSKLLQISETSSMLVSNYITDVAKLTWTNITAPATVKAATLIVAAKLFANRGDVEVPDYEITALPQIARDLLFNYHKPTVA